jgi:hypothetical protein
MAASIDPALLGAEFDVAEHPPVAAEELIAFARALGATESEYTEPGPGLRSHPTFCSRFRGRRFYPDGLPGEFDWRRGFHAGQDVELGVPVRPGDVVTVRSAVHDVYEKTGRSGTMTFVVMRLTLTNQRGERVAVVLNRFMHR